LTAAFEELNSALVGFCFLTRAERTEIATLPRFRILLARIQPILSGFELAYHYAAPQPCIRWLAIVLQLHGWRVIFCYFPCLASNSTMLFKTSGGIPRFPILRPLTKSAGVPVTSTDLPRVTDCSTRAAVSGFAAQAAMSVPFTPESFAITVSFSSTFASVISAWAV